MIKSDNLWESISRALRELGSGASIEKDLSAIDTLQVPTEFLTVPPYCTVVALGWGTGAWILRLATWSNRRKIFCIESDFVRRQRAQILLSQFRIENIEIVASESDAKVESRVIGLLLLDAWACDTETIQTLCAKFSINAIVGSFFERYCSDADIIRICSEVANYELIEETTRRRLIGRRGIGPKVTVIVTDQEGTNINTRDSFDATLNSLLAQDGISIEVIVATRMLGPDRDDLERLWGQRLPGGLLFVDPGADNCILNSALLSAGGQFVSIQCAGDISSPGMYANLFNTAISKGGDVVVSAYRQVQYFDGAISYHYTFGESGIDLRGKVGAKVSGALGLIELSPILGRYFLKRDLLKVSDIRWQVHLGRFAEALFVAQSLLAARSIVGVPEPHLQHRETYAQAIGDANRISNLKELERLVEALTIIKFSEPSAYFDELFLRRCLADLFLRAYQNMNSLKEKYLILRALSSIAFARMKYDSRWEFLIKIVVRKLTQGKFFS